MALTRTDACISTRTVPFYIHRNFSLLWIGRGISNLGDAVFTTTLILWVASIIARGQSWAPLATGGIFLATGVPVLLIGPLAGVFVDRWDKRRTMVCVDILRAILIALLLLFSGSIPLPWLPAPRLPALWQLGMIYAVLFCCSTCSQFFGSSRLALIGMLVSRQDRSRAIGLLQATQGTVSIIGPALAALLLFSLGVQWALLLNALSFVVSFLTLQAIHLPGSRTPASKQASSPFLRELSEGLRFFTGNPGLLTLLLVILVSTFGGVSLTTLGVYFVTDNLHIAARYFSLLDGALGVGVVIGGLCAAVFTRRLGPAKSFALAMLTGGLSLLVFARMTILLPALLLILLFGLFLSIVNNAVNTLLLHLTPQILLGRIMAIFVPLETLTSLVSTALVGVLVSEVLRRPIMVLGISLGRIDSIYLAAGFLFCLAGLYALIKLRVLEAPPAHRPG
ncbi:MAG TPA: MFS transporter [Ktedonobacteraceae bacterium]|jgi:MFS family permease